MSFNILNAFMVIYMIISCVAMFYMIQKENQTLISFTNLFEKVKESTINQRVFFSVIVISVLCIIRGSVLIFRGVKHNMKNYNARIEESKKLS